jgi:hypothetical protein
MKNRIPMNGLIRKILPWLIISLVGCVDPYNPPAIQSAEKFLVVEGFINAGQGATKFKLSYTRNLSDTSKTTYPNARVYVEGESGDSFELINQGSGKFEVGQLNLNPLSKYRLHVKLNDGKEYNSEFVEVKNSPEIDELKWKKSEDGVIIYLSTHDPQNKTRYYQWSYDETWEFHSAFYSSLKYENDTFVYRKSSEQIYTCYRSDYSKSILIGSSELLANDIIHEFPLIGVSANYSDKLSVRYSVLVQQYAISKAGFEYWNEIKKMTENLGSIYDPLPSTISGNIKCVQDPTEPVIGFVSASNAVEKRMFIDRKDYGFSRVFTGYESCVMDTVPGNGTPPKTFGAGMIPLFTQIDRTGATQLYVGSSSCVDCRLRGTIQKPSFW